MDGSVRFMGRLVRVMRRLVRLVGVVGRLVGLISVVMRRLIRRRDVRFGFGRLIRGWIVAVGGGVVSVRICGKEVWLSMQFIFVACVVFAFARHGFVVVVLEAGERVAEAGELELPTLFG